MTESNHDPADVESGKMMAALCYLPVTPVNLVLSIICLVQKNNAFSLYHAKQSMALMIVMLIALAICIPLMCIAIGAVLCPIVGVASLVFAILGIVNAAGGQYKPLPLVGGLADRLFGGIQKA